MPVRFFETAAAIRAAASNWDSFARLQLSDKLVRALPPHLRDMAPADPFFTELRQRVTEQKARERNEGERNKAELKKKLGMV